MVKAIRDVEKVLGDGIKKPTKEEEEIKKVVRRSIVAKVDIPEGAIITEEMLDVKRPGAGIETRYFDFILGKKAREGIRSDELIDWDKIY
jgi:N-acetylneuraminate synthase/N,N'-diacetyllegionaminate synthase